MGGAFAWTERVAAKVGSSHLNYASADFSPGATDVPDGTGHLSRPAPSCRRYDEDVSSNKLLTARPSRKVRFWRRYVQRNKRAIHLLYGVLEVDRPGGHRHGV